MDEDPAAKVWWQLKSLEALRRRLAETIARSKELRRCSREARGAIEEERNGHK